MVEVEGRDGEGDRQIHILTIIIPVCPVERQGVCIDRKPSHDRIHSVMTGAEGYLHPLCDFQRVGANGDDVKFNPVLLR